MRSSVIKEYRFKHCDDLGTGWSATRGMSKIVKKMRRGRKRYNRQMMDRLFEDIKKEGR